MGSETISDGKRVWEPVWFLALVFTENLSVKHFNLVTGMEQLSLTTDDNFL